MRRSPLIAALLAALLAVATGVPPASAEEATRPDNKPTPVEGHENGRLPDEELVWVGEHCRAHRSAASSLWLLFARARAEGVGLAARECYRPIDEQVAVRERWTAQGNASCAAPVRRDDQGRPIGTSNHGWGKAVDLRDRGGTLTFSSVGFRWMSRAAATYGWNHPGWAKPGGGPCPEAWHWEWVGDGGARGGDPIRTDVVGLLTTADAEGYAAVTGLGAVIERGQFPVAGDPSDGAIAAVVVGGTRAGSGGGHWLAAADGAVHALAGAAHHGDARALDLVAPVVAMAAAPDGDGYWLVGADGGVFSFGSAGFHGSLGSVALNRPIVGMAASPDGQGYWLVAADGGVFGFGTARFQGSLGDLRLNEPIVAMAATPGGDGYWLAAGDGGVFTFGSATFHGSAADLELVAPVVAMAPTPGGDGYWMAAADGGIFTFGAAPFYGAG